MATRIFSVELEHTEWGTNWSRTRVQARTAAEAIRKAERGEPRTVRAVGVELVAETD
jgi:hypothetical protein